MLPFLLAVSIVVVIHELGHFWMARLFNIPIKTFSIGFGPDLIHYNSKAKVRWRLAAIPLGGFVQIHGSLHKAPWWQRILVAAAGAMANLLLSFTIFFAIFSFKGYPEFVPVVKNIVAETPAAHSGIAPGDKILKINEKAIHGFQDIVTSIQASKDKVLNITVERDSAVKSFSIHAPSNGQIGIEFDFNFKSLSIWQAIGYSLNGVASFGITMVGSLTSLFSNSGGVIAIGWMSIKSFKEGFLAFSSFIAMLSMNLGYINLLPIPILDGGHILMVFLEKIFGKKLSQSIYSVMVIAGIMFLAALFIMALKNDLSRFVFSG